MRFAIKLAAGALLLGTILSGVVRAAEPNVTGQPALGKASVSQSAPSAAKKNRPLPKQKAKPADQVELKEQEAPKSATVVTPEVTEESVQLKGVRG